jgi:hypothetical protein
LSCSLVLAEVVELKTKEEKKMTPQKRLEEL